MERLTMRIIRYPRGVPALPIEPTEHPYPLSALYHENTKLTAESSRVAGARIEELGRDPRVLERQALAFKSYPTGPRIELPPVPRARRGSVEDVIRRRRTRRRFSGRGVDAKCLGRLLSLGCGITGESSVEPSGPTFRLRSYPSGGALYPLEVYPVVLAGEGVPPGLYHYSVYHHALERLREGPMQAQLEPAVVHEGFLQGASVILIITAVPERTLDKYGDRGYRYILIEAGHLAQNLLLVAEHLGLGAVPFGGFLDDDLARLLEIDPVDEFPLYLIGIGYPAR